ncbi:MAG: cysteine desulfurase family protein [Verrucomicrobiales bacterium]
MIYLDHHATTPVLPEVLEAMWPYFAEHFHNPSAGYQAGKKARRAMDEARAQVAELIGAKEEEIVFTSGGTEGNNMVLKSLARLVGRKDSRVVTSAIEHSAVLRPVEAMAAVGFETELVGVDGRGVLDLEAWRASLEKAAGKGFASLMWANNETGVVQPLAEACAAAKEAGLPFHTDAIQAVGKIPVDVREVPVDFLSLSGHKFHAPKGIGALYLREGMRFEPLTRGGGQEAGRRGGTESVALIVGLGKAAELAKKRLEAGEMARVATLRDRLEAALEREISGVGVNGREAERLPTCAHVSFEGCEGAGLLILLDEAGVQVSTGSACMSGQQQASHVQRAMGFAEARAKSSLRLSLSALTTETEVDEAVRAITKAVAKLRSVQGGSGVGPVVVYS